MKLIATNKSCSAFQNLAKSFTSYLVATRPCVSNARAFADSAQFHHQAVALLAFATLADWTKDEREQLKRAANSAGGQAILHSGASFLLLSAVSLPDIFFLSLLLHAYAWLLLPQ